MMAACDKLMPKAPADDERDRAQRDHGNFPGGARFGDEFRFHVGSIRAFSRERLPFRERIDHGGDRGQIARATLDVARRS